jgi:iron complex transport system permease protein
MGNFITASWDKFNAVLLPALAGLLVLYVLRWKLNVLALGDDEAISAGLNPQRIKIWVLLAATLASSAVIAVSGIIGLYGLIIPHLIRMMFGVDNKATLLLNFFLGGSLLVLIDDISRSYKGYEIPIGVFTMLLCAPLFIWLLKKTNIGWQQ